MTQRRFMLQVTVGTVLSIVLVSLVIQQLRTPPAAPRQPVLEQIARYGPAPDFSLVERSGRPVSAGDLRGRVWIADFIYTQCRDTCPLQSRAMAALRTDLKGYGDLRSVSISVDPLTDTPALLSRYADRYGADPERWLFLTGELGEIRRIVQDGFRLSAAPVDGHTHDSRSLPQHPVRAGGPRRHHPGLLRKPRPACVGTAAPERPKLAGGNGVGRFERAGFLSWNRRVC